MAEPEQPDASDAVLIQSALAGNVRSFEALLTRYQARVLRVLRLLGIPDQDREDVAQEVFLRVFRHLGGFRAGRPFGAWVYRVTVNSAHDFRVRQRRVRSDETPWNESAAGELADPAAGPEAVVRMAVDAARLEAALDLLSERERAVFVLKELEGLGTREAARALGVTTITVRRHLGLARRRLRAILESQAMPQKKEPKH